MFDDEVDVVSRGLSVMNSLMLFGECCGCDPGTMKFEVIRVSYCVCLEGGVYISGVLYSIKRVLMHFPLELLEEFILKYVQINVLILQCTRLDVKSIV